jgi:hypothetical protein
MQSTVGSTTVQMFSDGGSNYLQAVGAYPLELKTTGSAPMVLHTNNTERMRIDSSGNVGIGTSSPIASAKLDILAGTNARCLFRTGANTGGTSSGFGITAANSDASAVADMNYRAINHAFICDATERMRIDSSGNVGIGTSSPSYRLDVSGGHSAIRSAFAQFWFNSNNTNDVAIYNAGASGGGLGQMVFETASSERMRIDSSGRVLVGTTAQQGANSQLTISSSSSTNSPTAAWIGTQYASDVGNAALYVSKYDNNTTTSQIFVKFTVNNTNTASGQINANGASAAAFGSWSDKRLKENITQLPSQLANICALKPSEFDYKDGSGHQIGFIAQEMQEVYPDVVGEGEDGMLMVTGWSKTEARLVKAIQEQQAMIEQLTTRLNALEGK